MADNYPVISRAVGALDNDGKEARRVLLLVSRSSSERSPSFPRLRKQSWALFLIVGEPVLRPRIGKGGIEFSGLQSYFQSYLPNPSIGHRRVGTRPCGD
jgi:hypothetical protein